MQGFLLLLSCRFWSIYFCKRHCNIHCNIQRRLLWDSVSFYQFPISGLFPVVHMLMTSHACIWLIHHRSTPGIPLLEQPLGLQLDSVVFYRFHIKGLLPLVPVMAPVGDLPWPYLVGLFWAFPLLKKRASVRDSVSFIIYPLEASYLWSLWRSLLGASHAHIWLVQPGHSPSWNTPWGSHGILWILLHLVNRKQR